MAASLRVRGRMDRGAHLLEGAATADVGDCLVDVGIRGLGLFLEQSSHRHDHAALTVAALRYVEIDPSLLYAIQLAFLGKAFDGCDLRAGCGADRERARPRRHAIDMDCAGTALGDAATVLRSRHPDPFSDDPQQWGIGIDIHVMWLFIDAEAD